MNAKRILEWEHYDEDEWIAETKIDDYHVQQQDYRDGTTKYEASCGNEWPRELGAFDEPDAAIAACESDYIARCTEFLTLYDPKTHVVVSRECAEAALFNIPDSAEGGVSPREHAARAELRAALEGGR